MAHALFAIALLSGTSAGTATLQLDIEGARNARGSVHACLTQDRAHFPDCSGDPAAIRQSVPATARTLRFTGLAPGSYAVTLVHDENDNRKLDTFMGIPREGFGFSRNPVIRFGAPRFDKVNIDIAPGFARARVRMQYLL